MYTWTRPLRSRRRDGTRRRLRYGALAPLAASAVMVFGSGTAAAATSDHGNLTCTGNYAAVIYVKWGGGAGSGMTINWSGEGSHPALHTHNYDGVAQVVTTRLATFYDGNVTWSASVKGRGAELFPASTYGKCERDT